MNANNSQKTKQRICGILVTYNSDIEVSKTIKNAADELDGLIIIDNSSSEPNLTTLISAIDKVKNLNGNVDHEILLIQNSENMGLAKAYNTGVRMAIQQGYQFVLFLDPDSYIHTHIRNLLIDRYHYLSNRFIDVVLCCKNVEMLQITIDDLLIGYYSRKNLFVDQDVNEVLMAINSGLFLNVDTFNVVGFFDESYFTDSVDHEFSFRLLSSGYRIFRIENAIIFHNMGKPLIKSLLGLRFGVRFHTSLRTYYIFKDTLRTIFRYRSKFPAISLLLLIYLITKLLTILLLYPDKLEYIRKIAEGIIDSLKVTSSDFNSR